MVHQDRRPQPYWQYFCSFESSCQEIPDQLLPILECWGWVLLSLSSHLTHPQDSPMRRFLKNRGSIYHVSLSFFFPCIGITRNHQMGFSLILFNSQVSTGFDSAYAGTQTIGINLLSFILLFSEIN